MSYEPIHPKQWVHAQFFTHIQPHMLFQKVIIIQCGGFHAHLTNKQILLHQEDHQVQPTCCGEPLNRETTQSSFHEYIHCSKKERKKKRLDNFGFHWPLLSFYSWEITYCMTAKIIQLEYFYIKICQLYIKNISVISHITVAWHLGCCHVRHLY